MQSSKAPKLRSSKASIPLSSFAFRGRRSHGRCRCRCQFLQKMSSHALAQFFDVYVLSWQHRARHKRSTESHSFTCGSVQVLFRFIVAAQACENNRQRNVVPALPRDQAFVPTSYRLSDMLPPNASSACDAAGKLGALEVVLRLVQSLGWHG